MMNRRLIAAFASISMAVTAFVGLTPAYAANESSAVSVSNDNLTISEEITKGIDIVVDDADASTNTRTVKLYYKGISSIQGGKFVLSFPTESVASVDTVLATGLGSPVVNATSTYIVTFAGTDPVTPDDGLFATLTLTLADDVSDFTIAVDQYSLTETDSYKLKSTEDGAQLDSATVKGNAPEPTPTVAPTPEPIEKGIDLVVDDADASTNTRTVKLYYKGISSIQGGKFVLSFPTESVTAVNTVLATGLGSPVVNATSTYIVTFAGTDPVTPDDGLFATLTLTLADDVDDFIISVDQYSLTETDSYKLKSTEDGAQLDWDTVPGTKVVPTEEPTEGPTEGPTEEPSTEPTEAPSEEPTVEPTATPEVPDVTTAEPKPFQTPAPTVEPTTAPTLGPDETEAPTVEPTTAPAQAEVGLKDVVGDKVTDEYDGKTLNSLVVNVTTADGDPAVYGEDFVAVYDSRELSEDEYNNLINGYTYDPDTNTFTETQASAEALQSVIDGLIIKGNVGIDVKAGAGYGTSVAGEAKTTDPVTEVVYPSSESVLGSVKVTVTTPEGTTVTIKRNGVTLDPDEDAILVGDELELTFSGTGYDFTKWTIDGATLADSSEATDTTVTIVVDDDVQTLGITANATAAAGQIIVKITSPTSGKITVKDGDTTITSGDTVEVGTELSVACTGYSSSYNFSSWTASPSGVGSFDTKSSPSTTFTISDTTTASTVTIGASLTKRSSSSGNSSGGSSGSSSGGTGVIAGGSGSSSSSSGSTSSSTGFEDLDSVEWAVPAINALAKLGIINGRSDTIFDPNASVTRAEFIKMACAAFGVSSTPDASQTFTDVSPSDWFYGYVEAGVAAGITNGVSDTEFDPNATITREQMATMLNRALNAKSMTLSATTTKTFDDADQISDYAVESVTTLANAGVIKGVTDTEFQPQELATRAQAAALIYQLYQALGMTTSN